MKALVVLVLVTGCTVLPAPKQPDTEPPTNYPPAGCEEMCSTLTRLECRWEKPSCVEDCESANRELLALPGGRGLNTSCVAAATSCDAAFACR